MGSRNPRTLPGSACSVFVQTDQSRIGVGAGSPAGYGLGTSIPGRRQVQTKRILSKETKHNAGCALLVRPQLSIFFTSPGTHDVAHIDAYSNINVLGSRSDNCIHNSGWWHGMLEHWMLFNKTSAAQTTHESLQSADANVAANDQTT